MRSVWRNSRPRSLYISMLLVNAIALIFCGMALAEQDGGRRLDDDLRKMLKAINKPANPITPILSESAITTIPDQAPRDLDEVEPNDGKSLGLHNISELRFQSGRIVVIPPKNSNVVNSLVNFGGVVDADSFRTTKSGDTILAPSAR